MFIQSGWTFITFSLLITSSFADHFFVNCPEKETEAPPLLRHPWDCSRYYVCAPNEPLLYICPPGQLFDTNLLACNLETLVACGWNRTNYVDESGKVYEPVLIENGSSYSIECPTDTSNLTTYFSDPENCSRFIKCNQTYIPYSFQCSAGLYYNFQLEICDYPFNTECQESGINETSTANGSLDTCEAEVKCPTQNGADVTILPNPTDCGSFFICNWGTPILMSCPAPLHFNPILRVCDWPQAASCRLCVNGVQNSTDPFRIASSTLRPN